MRHVTKRLAIARQRMSELATIWKSRTVSRSLKARLIQALVWPIVTYGSEPWTLNKELCENMEAFEMQCYGRSMRISYTEHVTSDEVLRRVGQDTASPRRPRSVCPLSRIRVDSSAGAVWSPTGVGPRAAALPFVHGGSGAAGGVFWTVSALVCWRRPDLWVLSAGRRRRSTESCC